MGPQSPANPAAENIRAIVDLERQSVRAEGWAERLSDRISRFVGSLPFVTAHVLWFIGWAVWNAIAPRELRFDPYPYGLLTFVVSMEGVLIATFVLMTQNRMNQQSNHRDHLDLQVNLLAEQEMTIVLRLLRRICDHIGIPPEGGDAERAQQLTEQTNVYDLMETIKRELPKEKVPEQ